MGIDNFHPCNFIAKQWITIRLDSTSTDVMHANID